MHLSPVWIWKGPSKAHPAQAQPLAQQPLPSRGPSPTCSQAQLRAPGLGWVKHIKTCSNTPPCWTPVVSSLNTDPGSG